MPQSVAARSQSKQLSRGWKFFQTHRSLFQFLFWIFFPPKRRQGSAQSAGPAHATGFASRLACRRSTFQHDLSFHSVLLRDVGCPSLDVGGGFFRTPAPPRSPLGCLRAADAHNGGNFLIKRHRASIAHVWRRHLGRPPQTY